MSKLQDNLMRGTRAAQPAAAAANLSCLYYVTDEGITEQSDGAAWQPFSAASGAATTTLGTRAAQPAATTIDAGGLYFVTDEGVIERSNGTTWDAYSGSGGGGAVVQVVNTQTGAAATGTTVMPIDDSIPQNTEGDEYMSLAITPTDSANKLKIEIVAMLSSGVTNGWMVGALFQDSVAGALAASTVWLPSTASVGVRISFTHYMTAGTTSATTFKFRAGAGGAGTTTFNGNGGARLLGGVMASSITITEIAP